MRPTVVRLLGGVVALHPFKPHYATNFSGQHPTLIISSKAVPDQLVADLSV